MWSGGNAVLCIKYVFKTNFSLRDFDDLDVDDIRVRIGGIKLLINKLYEIYENGCFISYIRENGIPNYLAF